MKKRKGLGERLSKETGQLNGKSSDPRCATKSRVGEASLQLQKVNHQVFRTQKCMRQALGS